MEGSQAAIPRVTAVTEKGRRVIVVIRVILLERVACRTTVFREHKRLMVVVKIVENVFVVKKLVLLCQVKTKCLQRKNELSKSIIIKHAQRSCERERKGVSENKLQYNTQHYGESCGLSRSWKEDAHNCIIMLRRGDVWILDSCCIMYIHSYERQLSCCGSHLLHAKKTRDVRTRNTCQERHHIYAKVQNSNRGENYANDDRLGSKPFAYHTYM
eukprot:scaffold4396_cov204-Amphora_coffeaeformis.AAC.2